MSDNKQNEFLFTRKDVLGAVANWAVRQSPYHRPENLEVVLDKLNPVLVDVFGDNFCLKLTYEQLKDFLSVKLKAIPEFAAWNERKNGNQAQYKFTSRYDGEGDPNDDFIDLDALVRNVANEIVRNDHQKSIPEII